MPDPALKHRLDQIRSVIASRQQEGGWSHEVRILAVTKGHEAVAVRDAVAAGLRAVGENRVQEALPKQDACREVDVEWHLIGTLQRNKVRQVAGRFALIQSVDRVDLARELDRRHHPATSAQRVLLQVNCSGESQKGGVEPPQLEPLLAATRALQSLEVCGLMTLAEFTDDETRQRRAFASLRTARDAMQLRGYVLPELSMGMSADYPAAVAEGATMLRLGSALFGSRS